jgi:hypothetical protein
MRYSQAPENPYRRSTSLHTQRLPDCFLVIWQLRLDLRYPGLSARGTVLIDEKADLVDFDTWVGALLIIDNVGSQGRAGFQIKADGALLAVAEDLGEETSGPAIGKVG